jgi:phage terminase large subunit GpA-like protein
LRARWASKAGAGALGIDTGGHHTQAVYKFAWRKRKWRALKGASASDAVILSSPKWIEVKNNFGRRLFRVPLYFVGTHDLKVWLNRALKAIEQDSDMPGRLIFWAQSASAVSKPLRRPLASESLKFAFFERVGIIPI